MKTTVRQNKLLIQGPCQLPREVINGSTKVATIIDPSIARVKEPFLVQSYEEVCSAAMTIKTIGRVLGWPKVVTAEAAASNTVIQIARRLAGNKWVVPEGTSPQSYHRPFRLLRKEGPPRPDHVRWLRMAAMVYVKAVREKV